MAEPSKSEWRLGGSALAAAIVGYGAGFGLYFFTANLFIEPMRAQFGWSATEATFLPISAVVLAVLFPVSGWLVDRFGPRFLAIVGLLVFALCFVLLATVSLSVPIVRGIAVLLGGASAAAGAVPFGRSVASWFKENAGTALGLAMSGATLGGVLGVPMVAWLIGSFGWQAAYLGMAGISLLIGVPVLMLFFYSSEERGTTRDPIVDMASKEKRQQKTGLPLRDARLWLLTSALGLSAMPIGLFLNHLQPIMLARGFGIASATAVASTFAAATFFGRILSGFLLDRLPPLGVAGGLLALSALGALLASSVGTVFVVVALAMVLVGLSYGAEADFAAFFTLRFFGLEHFSIIFGIQAMVISMGVAFGGFAAARAVDIFGKYDLATNLAPLAFAMAAGLIFALRFTRRGGRPSTDFGDQPRTCATSSDKCSIHNPGTAREMSQ